MNREFEILNSFKGIGNPLGKYWFIGLEEAQDFNKNLGEILEQYSAESSFVQKNTSES